MEFFRLARRSDDAFFPPSFSSLFSLYFFPLSLLPPPPHSSQNMSLSSSPQENTALLPHTNEEKKISSKDRIAGWSVTAGVLIFAGLVASVLVRIPLSVFSYHPLFMTIFTVAATEGRYICACVYLELILAYIGIKASPGCNRQKLRNKRNKD